MNRLLHPGWVFLVVTLPQVLVFALFAAAYGIISSLLTEEHLRNWMLYGTLLAALGSAATAYALICLLRRRPLHRHFGVPLLAGYIPFLYAFAVHYRRIIPWSIPRWMLFHGDLFILVFAFVMPALIYGLTLVIRQATPEEKEHRAWKNFFAAVAIPLAWYLLVATNGFLVRQRAVQEVIPFVFIISTVAFLFLLLRAVFIMLTRKSGYFTSHRLIWLIPVSLIFPLLGLALHNGDLKPWGFFLRGALGDFRYPVFYLLAALNGVLLCLPEMRRTAVRMAVMLGRGITFPFTLYFFVVFLPYFPLSIFAIIVAGAGFLMLTPLILLPVHVNALYRDFENLRGRLGAPLPAAALAVSLIVLPASFGGLCLKDRLVLHRALDYVYAPDYGNPESDSVHRGSLRRVLQTVRRNNMTGRRGIFGQQTPYLTPLYQYLVLDNLTLSNGKIRRLERIFFGESDIPVRRSTFTSSDREKIHIDSVSTKTSFDGEGRFWRTEVHLEITSEAPETREYATEFTLPEGAWLSDFYLFVGERKEQGILAEKRTALWVYSNIVSLRRDPGILYYRRGGRIGFRVFPFTEGETRKAGFSIVHREPEKLRIDGHGIALGEAGGPSSGSDVTVAAGGKVHYVPAAAKASLKRVSREPYYHFIIDNSSGRGKSWGRPIQAINALLDRRLVDGNEHWITMANYGNRTFPLEDGWKEKLSEEQQVGGFYLERSVKEILRRHVDGQESRYPVLVVVTPSMARALVTGDFQSFVAAAPENGEIYHLLPDGRLMSYELSDMTAPVSRRPLGEISVPSVLAYPSTGSPLAYLPDNGEGSIVPVGPAPVENDVENAASDWEKALILQGMWERHQLHPEEGDSAWLALVRGSFSSGIMTPATSFVALENEAQKAALLAKQEKVLKAGRTLDLDSDSLEAMDEPPWWLVLLPLLVFVLYRRRGSLHS